MIQNIAVVGVGRMGRGIAAVYARRGFIVTIHDVSEEIIEQALETIRSTLGFLKEKAFITQDEVDAAMSRVKTTTNLTEAVSSADLITECVMEAIDLKKEVFAQLDERCGEQTILATNTSSLSVSEIAAATGRPDKVIGIHWLYPPYLIPAVEIVKARQSSDETVNSAKALVMKLGKTPIICRDVPGFVVNRLQFALFSEATSLLEQGVATAEDIDKAAQMVMGPRFPFWGPLRVEDMAAPKTTVLAIYEYLYKETGSERFRPPELVREKVRKGELGLVTGKGYYDFTNVAVDSVSREMDDNLVKMLHFMSELGIAKLP